MTNFHFGTAPSDVDTSIPELWAKSVLRDQLREGFWTRFVGGEGSGAAIIQKTELLNNPGDTIHISITSALTGAGVSGDTAQLVESEEKLSTTEKTVVPILYRHAVRVNRRANKKSILDLRAEAKLRLAEWGGEKMDDLRFANFTQTANLNGASYTPNIRVVGGGTGVDDIAAGDTLDVDSLMRAKLDLYNNRAKPYKTGSEDVFVAVVHPNTLYNLKRSTEYRDWVREAERRGADNPFFRGATVMIDGVVIFEHSNVPSAANAGAVAVSKNIVFGAEAFLEGVDENANWYEDEFDYGLEWGVGYAFATQPRRGLEKNSLQLYAAAVAPA